MKRSLAFLLLACSAAACGCGNFRDRAVLSSGNWTVDRVELDGKDITDEAFEISFAPNSEAITITVGDVVHKGLYELDSAKNPKEIDIKPEASNLKDKPLKGIYAVESDGRVLMLCLSPTKRPKRFETSGTNNILIKLTREQVDPGVPPLPGKTQPPPGMPPGLMSVTVHTQLAPPLLTETATLTLIKGTWRETRPLIVRANVPTQVTFLAPGEGTYQYQITTHITANFGSRPQMIRGNAQGEIEIESGKKLVYGRLVDPTASTCTCTLAPEK